MIPTWTDHAHEAGRCVRFALGNAIVRVMRYVAHLSATVREGHPSAPQEPPMTTLAERHEADQDDADRYAPRPGIHQISAAITEAREHAETQQSLNTADNRRAQ